MAPKLTLGCFDDDAGFRDRGTVVELIRLPIGVQVAVDTDCIRVEQLKAGSFRLTGTALCVSEDAGTSISLMNGLTYSTLGEAEEAGLAWAGSVGVKRLFISTGTLDRPLESTKIDLPE